MTDLLELCKARYSVRSFSDRHPKRKPLSETVRYL